MITIYTMVIIGFLTVSLLLTLTLFFLFSETIHTIKERRGLTPFGTFGILFLISAVFLSALIALYFLHTGDKYY